MNSQSKIMNFILFRLQRYKKFLTYTNKKQKNLQVSKKSCTFAAKLKDAKT